MKVATGSDKVERQRRMLTELLMSDQPAIDPAARRAGQARPVVVTHVERETADAVSLTFRDPTAASLAYGLARS